MKHQSILVAGALSLASLASLSSLAAGETIVEKSPWGDVTVELPEIPARQFPIAAHSNDVNAAMAAAAAAGGGHVVVPKGTWLPKGPVKFRSNCALELADGAVLEFSDDPKDYLPAVHTTWEGSECMNYSPLVYAYGCTNVAIVGRGELRPRLKGWQEWQKRPPAHQAMTAELYHWMSTNAPVAVRDVTQRNGNFRPHLIQFNRSNRILLRDFKINGSPFWTTHLYLSRNVLMEGVDSYAHGHNNDGVDVEMTQDVIIRGCRFDQGDDGVVLKAGRNQDGWRLATPTRNVVVRDCELVEGHGLLVVGSEMAGGVENVYMRHCKATGRDVRRVMYLKTNERRGGFMRRIAMEDCTAKDVRGAAFGIETDVLYQWAKLPTYEVRLTEIDDIVMRDCTIDFALFRDKIRGDPRRPIGRVTLENVRVKVCATPAMEVLPLGAVRPEGWLAEQLRKQADGLTGHAEELYEDIGKSDWLTGANVGKEFAWERGLYYAKGLVALALVLDDAALKAKAKRWVDAILRSQRADGDFGPKKGNWWANMIALCLLRDWCEATGDARVVPFLERYFTFQREALKTRPLASDSMWAVARAGDEIDVALWLAHRTGWAEWVDCARVLAEQSTDWTTYYERGGDPKGADANDYRSHVVNFMQGLKTPALQFLLDGDPRHRDAYAAAFAPGGWAMRLYGRPDRMLNGTEPLSNRSASGGTELCAIAERILSCQTVLSAVGDLAAADDLEFVAYNALPAALAKDGRGMRCYLLPNFAWPKFVQSMWMRKDGGLAALLYGPSRVTTDVGGRKVVLETKTAYPFDGKVTIRVVEGGGRFPIYVRVPSWTGLADAGCFRTFARDWKAGDEIVLDFPQPTRLSFWDRDAVAVARGRSAAVAAGGRRHGGRDRHARPDRSHRDPRHALPLAGAVGEKSRAVLAFCPAMC